MDESVEARGNQWNPSDYCWEDEIDLRELVSTILKWWWMVVLITLVAAISAFGFATLTKSVQYEASATITGTTSKAVQLSSSIATSNSILKKLYASLGNMPDGVKSYEDLSGYLSVRTVKNAGSKSGVAAVNFNAKAMDPGFASELANKWSSLVVETTNDALRKSKEEDLEKINTLFSRSEENLFDAEKNLAEIEKENKVAIIGNRLSYLKNMQSQYLSKEKSIKLLLQDVIMLESRLEQRKGDVPSLTDDLAVMSLSLRSVGGSGNIQLQVSKTGKLFYGDSMEERIVFLKNMQKELESKVGELDIKSRSLDTQILEAQYELQKAKNKLNEAVRKRDIALKNYEDLSEKLEEAKIAAGMPQDRVEILAKAVTPSKPLPRRRLLNTAIAAVVGFMLAVFMVFAIEWWQGGESSDGQSDPS